MFEPAVQREVQREVTIEKEVLRTEKQASLDELTASFAHEIRNPIAAAKSLVQQMGEDPTSSENVDYAKVALDELARVERSVSHLLKYAKEEDYGFDNVNLAAVLDAAITQMRAKLEAKNVSRVAQLYRRADGPRRRRQAAPGLHQRHRQRDRRDGVATAANGTWKSRSSTLRPASATVVIRDNGCGIPDDKLSKIFNPFYTTKPNGTGLGMGIAKKVMDAHNGRIEVHSQRRRRHRVPDLDAARRRAAPAESMRRKPRPKRRPRVAIDGFERRRSQPAATAPRRAPRRRPR